MKHVHSAPTEIKLVNGVVMRKVSIVRWNSDSVVLKHQGGIDPVLFAKISPEDRTKLIAFRDAQKFQDKPGASSNDAQAKSATIEGQVFVATRGSGNYKLGSVYVYAFPIDRVSSLESFSTPDLGKPIASSVSDAEGKFKLTINPEQEFFIFAQASRLAGSYRESYQWTVKSREIKDRSNVILSNHNLSVKHQPVKIDTAD